MEGALMSRLESGFVVLASLGCRLAPSDLDPATTSHYTGKCKCEGLK